MFKQEIFIIYSAVSVFPVKKLLPNSFFIHY